MGFIIFVFHTRTISASHLICIYCKHKKKVSERKLYKEENNTFILHFATTSYPLTYNLETVTGLSMCTTQAWTVLMGKKQWTEGTHVCRHSSPQRAIWCLLFLSPLSLSHFQSVTFHQLVYSLTL